MIDSSFGPAVTVVPGPAKADTIIVCEHASNRVPESLNQLGVSDAVLESHVAWDPGALGVATELARRFHAPLVRGEISRLVYDCNRPPDAQDAIPAKSEVFAIPGNADLGASDRKIRIDNVYHPFRDALAQEIHARRAALNLLITIHSFTPTYMGVAREVEIGILHGADDAVAHRMMKAAPANFPYLVRLNEPYSATDGVAHTLDAHGTENGLANVMIEIRNDLISDQAQQIKLAQLLGDWIDRARADDAAELRP